MTHDISAMIDAHRKGAGSLDKEKLAECIAACLECAQTRTACADACLGEDMVVDLGACIRTDLDCADICATGNILTRLTGAACAVCAGECERHAGMHEHCRICAEACRRCANACAVLLDSMV